MAEAQITRGEIILRRSADERKPLIQRLNRIEGQLRGIRMMIEDDRHCADEIVQIKAALAALREVAMLIGEQHVTYAARTLREGVDPEPVIGDIMRVLREATRI